METRRSTREPRSGSGRGLNGCKTTKVTMTRSTTAALATANGHGRGRDDGDDSHSGQNSQNGHDERLVGGIDEDNCSDGSQGVSVVLSQYSQMNDERGPNYLLQFVLPKDKTKTTCSSGLKLAFKMCRDSNLTCEWLEEKYFPDIIPMPGNIFVLDPFEGPAFDHLNDELKKSKNFLVIGPQCLRFSLQRTESDCGILNRGFPMYTLGMRNLVISFSGFRNRAIRAELVNLVRKMGGFPAGQFTLATTHLVTDNVLSAKCSFAYLKNMPVMTEDWIRETWKRSLVCNVHATDEEFVKFVCPIFYKLEVCVSQINAIKKTQLRQLFTSNGGIYSAELLRDQTNVLIIPRGEGDKFKFAQEWGIHCVTEGWAGACKTAGHVIDMAPFTVKTFDAPRTSTPLANPKHGAQLLNMPTCSYIEHPTKAAEESVSNLSTPNFSILSEPTAEDFAAIKDASLVGPFLDGCKVYLCDPDKSLLVRKLLNGSGATRLNQLTETVTHVVVMGKQIPSRDIEIIKKMDPRPYVVGFEWVTVSAKKGSPAMEELYQFKYEGDADDLNNNPDISQVPVTVSSTSFRSGRSSRNLCEKFSEESPGRRCSERKQRNSQSQVVWSEGRNARTTFMFTGISDEDRELYSQMLTALGGLVNSASKFSITVDAIIAGTLSRSEKVLCAIASGKRVLRPRYLITSQNTGTFLGDPDAFLWGFGDGRNPAEELLAVACTYWYNRIKIDCTDRPFAKFRALVVENAEVKAEAYKNLISVGGGKIYGKEALESVNIIICESAELVKKFLGVDVVPKIAVKPPLCLHEIIIKCRPCTDAFFEV